MDSVTLSSARVRGPRLLGMAGGLAAVLALILINWPSGASAAPGPTDLALTKSDSPDPVAVEAALTYTIQVTNPNLLGGNDATGVVVTDPLSASDVDFVSATATSGTCQHQANTVTCSLGTINAATTATVTIVVKPKKTGTLSNTASVTSPEDSTPANNQATATTVVNKKGKTGKKGKASCATPTIVGTAGDDTIVGTAGADVIVALAGNDQVFAGGGKDLICADGGADLVSGGPGGDTVIGGTGPDRLVGNSGNDLLKGKGGRDRLRGNAGNDFLNGGRNRDSCRGGAGADTLVRCP
jgi:uncharacterized repeat protein (TIGR01451 family)